MILGNIPTPPSGSIETWLLAFAAIVAIANQGVALLKNFKNSPQFIQLAEQFVSRGSFHKHAELNRLHHERIEARVAALERQLQDDKDEIIAKGQERADGLHERLGLLFTALGEVKGELKYLGKGK